MENNILFTNAQLIDPEGEEVFKAALHVSNGQIIKIIKDDVEGYKKALSKEHFQEIDCKGQYLAPGIIDIGVKIGEPGERHKESFRTAGLAAAAGGVTTIVMRSDTTPPIDKPETLEFAIRRANESLTVNFLPMATLTKNREGEQMSEIGFLHDAGAVAFSDGDHVVPDTKVLQRAMIYAASHGALIIGHPQEAYLSKGAVATSGPFATKLGLSAVSPMAEKLGLQRDMALVEMTGVNYHVDQLTTALALPVLERAKKAGLKVTAGASIHHLTLNEFDIGNYRTFFKFKPPLRSESDRKAIVEALKSGLIDSISSMHTPQDEESKRLPFEEAASGAVGLETLLSAALRLYHSGDLTLPELFKALSLNPARLLNLPQGRLKEGAPADLILFDPNVPFIMDRYKLHSKSKNTPFDEQRMQGKVLKSFVGGKEVYSA